MPVDPGANPKDKMKALAAVAFLVVAFIVIYIVAKYTGGPPPNPGANVPDRSAGKAAASSTTDG